MSRTAIQSTSLETYFNYVLPSISERQREALKVFIDNPTMTFTNMELAENELHWSINRVTGRVHELRGKGKNNPLKNNPILIESKRGPCKVTNYGAIAWQMNPYWRPGGYKTE